jgi:hypothetical protein
MEGSEESRLLLILNVAFFTDVVSTLELVAMGGSVLYPLGFRKIIKSH